VDMGNPLYESTQIPVNIKSKTGLPIVIDNIEVYAVNTGVPHAVIFVDDIKSVDINNIAPKIRHNELFPNGINVNFVQITGKSSISIRTFERGVESETLSCGTGSTASALISTKVGKVSGSIVHVDTIGGPLDICVTPKVTMTGAAETVYTGQIQF
ncbi:MAG TPA: diaminopimelate epimerase, partial [Methanocorpusculum sp.]|nr:diaminopimelate epimerase [Methanocorpusculum sp.]